MGLEERLCKAPDKIRSKIRVGGGKCQIFHKGKIRSFQGRKNPQPLFFLDMPEGEPAVKLIPCDGKAFKNTFCCGETGKVLRKDAENEK